MEWSMDDFICPGDSLHVGKGSGGAPGSPGGTVGLLIGGGEWGEHRSHRFTMCS